MDHPVQQRLRRHGGLHAVGRAPPAAAARELRPRVHRVRRRRGWQKQGHVEVRRLGDAEAAPEVEATEAAGEGIKGCFSLTLQSFQSHHAERFFGKVLESSPGWRAATAASYGRGTPKTKHGETSLPYWMGNSVLLFARAYYFQKRNAYMNVQPADIGWPTGNGKKLTSTQAQLGQATCLAVA